MGELGKIVKIRKFWKMGGNLEKFQEFLKNSKIPKIEKKSWIIVPEKNEKSIFVLKKY